MKLSLNAHIKKSERDGVIPQKPAKEVLEALKNYVLVPPPLSLDEKLEQWNCWNGNHLTREDVLELIARFPYHGVLYRGLTFTSRSDYETFLDVIKMEGFEDYRASSWTTDLEVARTFATGKQTTRRGRYGVVLKHEGEAADFSAYAQQQHIFHKNKAEQEKEMIVAPGKIDAKVIEWYVKTKQGWIAQ